MSSFTTLFFLSDNEVNTGRWVCMWYFLVLYISVCFTFHIQMLCFPWTYIYIYIYICHRHEIWVQEKTKRFGCTIVTGDSGIDAGRCADELWHFLCTCTVVFPLEDQSRWSWHHEMMSVISDAILGGNYKRRAHMNLGAVIWVFWYWTVGSIDKTQTHYSGYVGASCGAEHNQEELCVLFIHMHVPRPFGNFLVSMTLVVWC